MRRWGGSKQGHPEGTCSGTLRVGEKGWGDKQAVDFKGLGVYQPGVLSSGGSLFLLLHSPCDFPLPEVALGGQNTDIHGKRLLVH